MTALGFVGYLCLLIQGQLEVEPAMVRLVGSDGQAQVLVSRKVNSKATLDLTDTAVYETADPSVAIVEATGRVRATGPGRTRVHVHSGELTQSIEVEVFDFSDERPVGFTTQIVPILTRHGCNAGGCHGKASGQNGFRLSLLGFDPKFDYEALVREARGRRVFPAAPAASLMLRKPTASVPHGGGRKFEVGSPEYRMIERWIRGGMALEVKEEPGLVGIKVFPERRVLAPEARQQLRVEATYSDGSVVDVTGLSQYQSNSADLATVNEHGQVQAVDGVGEAAIMVRFSGLVTVARAVIPAAGPSIVAEEHTSRNLIDPLVAAKLRELNLPASLQCTDAEFARRSSLDIRGVLPTPDEVTALEMDKAADKRARWIDRLLNSPEYADYFAMKWAAILRNARGPQFFGDASKSTTFAFHAWIRESLAENLPYDRFAGALIAARGDPASNPAVAWYRTRDLNNPTNEAVMEDTAQLFLGMRIQCAKCHHHPFERWSQDDYYGFASFFSRIGRKASEDPFTPRVFTLATGKAKHPDKGTEYAPKALGGPEFKDLGPREDPRDKLTGWLVAPANPYFAQALVNRYWKHFFGRGLVEPEDDMRISNPASNPALLEALSRSFIESGFDLKSLVRQITTSDTYARSSLPTGANLRDRQNFARFYPRRLPAEVLLDAIDRVTDTRENYAGMPEGYRAVQLPDEGFGSYFLEVFGRPKRESVCECERTAEPSLAQRLHLLNSDDIEQKVVGRRSEDLAKAAESNPNLDADNVTLLYRLSLSRIPSAEEQATCLAHLMRARAHGTLKSGYEDLIWSLINSSEFLFNR